MLLKIILLNYFLLTNSYKFTFLKKTEIYNSISKLIEIKNNKLIQNNELFILDGEKTDIKRDYCKMICDINNFNFEEYTFKDFILNLPYNIHDKTMIYVNNFLIGNGRILNSYEQDKLLHIPITNNIILLETENLQNISLKDNNLIRKFNILNFPKITKKDIRCYIYDIINKYNYDDNLYLLNWTEYNNIDKLNLEQINILLFEINNMILEKINFNIIHNQVNYMINLLLTNLD
jgi:hypothetical protein